MLFRRRSFDRPGPSSLARAAGRADQTLLEGLEPRVLLSSGALSPGGAEPETVLWNGGHVVAVPDSFIVAFDGALGNAGAIARTAKLLNSIGATAREINPIAGGRYAEFVTQDPVNEKSLGFGRTLVEGVGEIEPNPLFAPSKIPNDPLFNLQWQHDNTGQPVFGQTGLAGADANTTAAWDLSIGSSEVIVGVIDTGIDLDHPDLEANIFVNPGEIPDNDVDDDGNGFVDDVNGWDFGDNDNDPRDVEGHGTQVSGTIAAAGNNGIGVAGVAWEAKIIPLRVSSPQFPGLLSGSAILGAHNYLTMMIGRGFNIVASNNSYGSLQDQELAEEFQPSQITQAAIAEFIDAGATFVAAAGNESNDNDEANDPEGGVFDVSAFPASFPIPGIISVAATDNNDALADFSNFGNETVDLGAPGVGVFTTTLGGGFASVSGTSFSSPMVAGAVALLKSLKPNASPIEVREALMNSVDPLPSLQGKTQSGGRLNVGRALEIIGLDGPVVKQISPGPVTTDPVGEIKVSLSEPIDPALFESFGTGAVTLERSGQKDGTFDDGNESTIGILSVDLAEDGRSFTVAPAALLGAETYRLTLRADAIADLKGNFLNGNLTGGKDEEYQFQAVSVSGTFEPNDSMATATPVPFNTSGTATLAGATIGDGLFPALDVDLYRLDLPRGGLISAEVIAQNLPSPSSLDSHLRLFDAEGNELAANDQFNGSDSFIEFFVTTGGAYFVGVSGFPNSDFDPGVAGSGTSQSGGNYTLELTVELVEDEMITVSDDLITPPDIPDGGTLTDTIFVEDARQILDVDVSVDVTHDFVGDLELTLIAPTGERVTLADGVGSSGEGFSGTIFDDEAAVSIGDGTAPFTGAFRPEETLGNFDGISAAGTWTLEIKDTAPTGSGELLGWSLTFELENDIFGPFELNDTLATASDLGLEGGGSTTVNAVIGDGGFGSFDVDVFALNVEAGNSLSVSAKSGGTLDTALRLFDETGKQLQIAAPPAGRDSSIDFVFPSGGTFFIGVSSSDNQQYLPQVAGSGAVATTTGGYSLEVSLAPGVSDPEVILEGNRIELMVGDDGTIGGEPGLRFENVDFLLAPSGSLAPQFFGAFADTTGFKNSSDAGAEVPFSLTDESDDANRRATIRGVFKDLEIERSISFGVDGNVIAFDVRLTNLSNKTRSSVAWMEGLNPNMGLNLSPSGSGTFNDVDDENPFASARFTTNSFPDGLTVALAAPAGDDRAQASFIQPTTQIRDAGQLLNIGVQDPDGAFADEIMTLGFDFGELLSGQTVTARYFVIFGSTPTQVDQVYASINDGTGTNHATANPDEPALDEAGIPELPFHLFFPEGFANFRSSTFVPILNGNNTDSRVVVVARYETGERDDVLFDEIVPANSRSGLTLSTPELFAEGTQLVRKNSPFAIEIRSALPVSATMSHFDFGGSTGESFTSRTSAQWTFSRATKGQGSSDFLTFFNPGDETIKITTTLIPAGGGDPIELISTLEAYRRGGWNLGKEPSIPDGEYGVLIAAKEPIVASQSSFDTTPNDGTQGASIQIGTIGLGSLTGASPAGQFGIGSQLEKIPILNATPTDTTVELTFVFSNGSSIREFVDVVGRSVSVFDVSSISNFPKGLPYGVIFESSLAPVSVSLPANGFSEQQVSVFAGGAHPLWTFADGFRPAKNPDQVSEFLRVFNPQAEETLIEVTLRFTDGTRETSRFTIGDRRVAEIDVHSLIPENLLSEPQFYGIEVKGGAPVVSYIARTDAFFGNGSSFGTLLTPLGAFEPLA